MTIRDLLERLEPEERDVVLRTLADKDNELKRAKKAALCRYVEGIDKAIKEIVIPVFDDLLRLLEYVEQRRMKGGHITKDEVHDNIEMPLMALRAQFYIRLDDMGVGCIPTSDTDFDPRWMEAVEVEYTDRVHPGAVVDVALPGYFRGDTLLRPAHVVVSARAH